MQNNGQGGEQPNDVGLRILRFISLRAVWFRKNRSTADNLVYFDSYIHEAIAKKEHVIAIFFHVEKAYNTMWKYCILCDLYDLDF